MSQLAPVGGGLVYSNMCSYRGEMTDRREAAAVIALAARTHRAWHLLSQALEEAGTALDLAAGIRTGDEPPELDSALERVVIQEAQFEENERLIEELASRGVSLVTVLDDAYPANLRLVYDRPPFLFMRGELRDADRRAIAVVGTRSASDEGLREAGELARGLTEHGVTVVSGLAVGIDTAAHRATLDAGGRTVAVIGNGIDAPLYPRENVRLADEIVASGGAVVSQFLPQAPPRQENFRLRNRTMSGLALGTTVVEASGKSGARMQARIALEHMKRVFLVRELVTREEWAQQYLDHPGVTVVEHADEVLDVLDVITTPPEQLSLTA
jgi:DNA processing protein